MLFNNNDENMIKRLFKKEEKHQANAISFYDLFLMCKDRFIGVENELYELKKILEHHFVINNMVFKDNINGELGLVIEFYDNKKEYIILSIGFFDDVNTLLDTTNGKYDKLINSLKSVIRKVFRREDRIDISKSFNIESSTKIFNISGETDEVSLKLNNKNLINFFRLNYYFDIKKVNDSDLINYFECKTSFYDIKKELEDLENLKKFLLNIKVNEKDIPKVLLKK